MADDDPPTDLVCCFNCVSKRWLVAVGQGVCFFNPANMTNPEMAQIGFAPVILSARYVCPHFVSRRKPKESDSE